MKKLLIGSLVGAIIVFGWQTFSWTVSGIHDKAYKHVSNQDSIINALSAMLPGDGQYMTPSTDRSTSRDEQMKQMEQAMGHPWAVITYHKAMTYDMGKSIVKAFLVTLICVVFVCWVIRKHDASAVNFMSVFFTTLTFGLVCFLYVWYNQHIWFQTPWDVLTGELIDNLASWGLCGIWLGWWYSRK